MLIETLLKDNKIISFPVPSQMNDSIVNQILTAVNNLNGFHVARQPRVPLSAKAMCVVDGLVSHLEREKLCLI